MNRFLVEPFCKKSPSIIGISPIINFSIKLDFLCL